MGLPFNVLKKMDLLLGSNHVLTPALLPVPSPDPVNLIILHGLLHDKTNDRQDEEEDRID